MDNNFLELVDIISIKRVGYKNVVDIQVADDESFTLANGIVSHNSSISSFAKSRLANQGAIPIRGKFINVNDLEPVKVLANEEANTLMKVIGLKIGQPATGINFGKIAILSDQDYDGNAIAGLLVNFFYTFWPELIEQKKIIRVLSPLFIAKKGKTTKRFYTYSEYKAWTNDGSYSVIYAKGLGSLGDDYKNVLQDLKYIEFSADDDIKRSLEVVYGKDSDLRKEWMSSSLSTAVDRKISKDFIEL